MQKTNKNCTSNHNESVGGNNPICLNNVGENCVFPHSKGITLIALIITIIVMIILVGVTVSIALNGGLFTVAKDAAENTIAERDKELELSTGAIIDEWVNGGPISLPEGWEETEKPAEWDNDKIVAVTDGTNIIPLPQGYEISKEEGENTIEEGVVIKDSKENEFVWIPVTEDFTTTYGGAMNYSEPKELIANYSSSGAPYDSQATLDYLYGEGYFDYPETEEEKADVKNSFAYKAHYEEMVESVNKYNGFYIGRYETTIDENNEIGSIENIPVLTVDKTIPQANNEESRWYGLYYTGRNSNVTGNQEYIQTNMIWGQQWDKMLKYFDSRSIDYSEWGQSTQGAVVNSGQSTNSNNEKDEIYNIYDLRTNSYEWTAETGSTDTRVCRGGMYSTSKLVSDLTFINPTNSFRGYVSRLTLYIK